MFFISIPNGTQNSCAYGETTTQRLQSSTRMKLI